MGNEPNSKENEPIIKESTDFFLSGPFRLHTGFDFLLDSGHFMIRQEKLDSSRLSRYEKSNNYEIFNKNGRIALTANERSSFLSRFILRNNRKFQMDLKDNYDNLVLSLTKPRSFSVICGCAPTITAVSTDNEEFGFVRQVKGFSGNPFVIYDWLSRPQLIIKGPLFSCQSFVDLILKVYVFEHQTESIGRIVRRYSNQADFFTVIFPLDLDQRLKILLLCAALLIDYVYFE